MTTQTNETSNVVETSKTNFTAKQKMILAICAMASVVIIVLSSAFATVAYLTSSAAVSNVFTIGSVGITMTESKVDINGVLVDGGATQVDTNTYHLVPNKTYVKDPHITFTEKSEDSYLFVLVRNDISSIADPDKPSIAQQMAQYGWAKYTKASTGWVYVYVGFDAQGNSLVDPSDAAKTEADAFNYEPMKVSEGTYYLFKEFSISPSVEEEIKKFGAAKITLTAVAIQDEGFVDDEPGVGSKKAVDKAWEAVVATYPYIHTGTN